MLAPIDVPPEVDALHARCKQLAAELLQTLSGDREPTRFKTGEEVWSSLEAGIYFLQDGFLQLRRRDRIVRYYGKGDIIQVTEPRIDFTLCGEWPSVGILVPEEELLDRLAGDRPLTSLWWRFNAAEQRLMQGLCAQYADAEVDVRPQLRRYEKGEEIMTAGQPGREVQMLVEGKAHVYIDGIQIGEANPQEFLGEIAFLTDAGEHKATVIAATTCLAHVIDGEQFERMIRLRPHTIAALARTLAQRLVRANDELAHR